MSYTRGEVLATLKTGMTMIKNKSNPDAIRAFMDIAKKLFGIKELLYAIDYLEQYKPLLKYL